MVEFALIAPIFFILLFGLIVLVIVVKNQIGLENATRDAVRAAAICGGNNPSDTTPNWSNTTLPDGSRCDASHIQAYAAARLKAVDPNSPPNDYFSVIDSSGTPIPSNNNGLPYLNNGTGVSPAAGANDGQPVGLCSTGNTLDIEVQYNQPLYLPLMGLLLGNGSNNTRTLYADGEALCEQ